MLTEQRRGPRTRREYVNVNDASQRRYWCDRLACNEDQLREGIRAVGASVEAVRRYLGKYMCADTTDQRRHWCRQLECTESQLFDAVTAVGLLVEDVRRYLVHRESAALRRGSWASRAIASSVGVP